MGVVRVWLRETGVGVYIMLSYVNLTIRETLGRKLVFASYLSACFAVYGIPDPSGWYN